MCSNHSTSLPLTACYSRPPRDPPTAATTIHCGTLQRSPAAHAFTTSQWFVRRAAPLNRQRLFPTCPHAARISNSRCLVHFFPLLLLLNPTALVAASLVRIPSRLHTHLFSFVLIFNDLSCAFSCRSSVLILLFLPSLPFLPCRTRRSRILAPSS